MNTNTSTHLHATDLNDPVDAWVRAMRAKGLAARTITERARLIRHITAITGTSPTTLTPADIEHFLAGISSPGTRYAYYSVLRAWHQWQTRHA